MQKKSRIICLVIAMVLCVPFFALQIFAAAGFTDVADDHWGLDYIAAAKANKIIEGYEQPDGTWIFKPEANVSKQECLTMLYRTMDSMGYLKAQGSDFIDKWTSVMEDCSIAPWAYEYVAYYFEYGFISPADFTEVQGAAKGGAVPASRQLIAKWTALSMGYEIPQMCTLKYKDSASMGVDFIQYIDALYREGIMEGNAGTFNPVAGVRRVEMATVCTRLLGLEDREKHNNKIFEFTGKAADFNSTRRCFSFSDQISGKTETLHISPDAQILIDGVPADFEALAKLAGKYINVSCYTGGCGSVQVQTGPKLQSGSVTAIDQIDAEKSETGKAYRILCVKLDNGSSANYIVDSSSETVSSIRAGYSYSFIADGLLILQLR